MFCSNCGSQLIDGAKFCGKCGNPVKNPAQQETPQHTSQVHAEYKHETPPETPQPHVEYKHETPQGSSDRNGLYKPTDKSGFSKARKFFGIVIVVMVCGFLVVQIALQQVLNQSGIDPNLSFNVIWGSVGFFIIFWFAGKNVMKNKCKRCKHFDGKNKCTRMNMDINAAVEFDCKYR